MTRLVTLKLCLVVLIMASTAMSNESIISVYTPLPDNPEKQCKVLERGSEQNPPPGYLKAECPGYADYQVSYATDGDHGSFLSLFHNKKKREWPLVTLPQPEGVLCPQGYAWVTARQLEWRVMKSKGTPAPFALIYRVSCIDMMSEKQATTEILAVAALSPKGSCLIGKVRATGNQEANAQARTLADKLGARHDCN